MGASTSCWSLPSKFYQLALLSILFGLGEGCFICLLGPIAFDLLGPAGAAQGIGCLFHLMSYSLVIGPPIVGEFVLGAH